MNSKCEINRNVWLTDTTARATLVYRLLGAFLLTAFLLVGGLSQFAWAGVEPAFPQGMNPEQVAATMKGNAQALKAFSYQQRTQLQVKGETKKVTLNQMNYDINGNQQKTLLSEQPSADSEQSSGGGRGGRLRKKVIAKKKGEFKKMMEEIASLVKSYTELPPERLQAALQRAAFGEGQGDIQGATQIQMTDVLQQGDALTLWIDQTSMLFRKVTITTTYEKNPVTATANYATLPSGQAYMAQSVLNYPKKEVVVQIDNLNYQQSK